MHFWRIERLKEELRRGPLGARPAFGYLLAMGLFYAATSGMPGLWNAGPDAPDAWAWAGYAAYLLLVVLGTVWAYRANGSGAGADFAARYTALGWVVGVRLTILILVPGVAIFLIGMFATAIADGVPAGAAGSAEASATRGPWEGPLAFAIIVALEVFYYWRLAHHLRDVARAEREPPAAPAPPAGPWG